MEATHSLVKFIDQIVQTVLWNVKYLNSRTLKFRHDYDVYIYKYPEQFPLQSTHIRHSELLY